jgi:hypothetical protein
VPPDPDFARRLREARRGRFGESGGPLLAEELGVSWRRWSGYEAGRHNIPGVALLRFIETTGAGPRWLLHGIGPKHEPYNGGRGRSSGRPSRPDDGDGRGV